SDHLYYLSTKGLADGAVHKYFSPYEQPYEGFINYMNILQDLKQRVMFR
ncbi:MAG TPA: alpha-amylase, partial [Thermoplasmatales archaeon]|nr:alpha-amylase [Thermoplasmatales archaeon]